MRRNRSSFILGKQKGQMKSFSQNRHKKTYLQIVNRVITDSHIILEILDARFIDDMRNKELENSILSYGKKLIYVLNKADLTNLNELKERLRRRKMKHYVIVSCIQRKGGKQLRDKIKIEAHKLFDIWNRKKTKDKAMGIKNEEEEKDRDAGKVFVGVIGYPNCGKSSIINLLLGRPAAKTAFEAGYTKGIQKVKLMENIFILDTPGVVPLKESRTEEGYVKAASIGARNFDKIREPEFVVGRIMKNYPGVLERFYDSKTENDVDALIDEVGRKKGFLKKGNEVDVDRTSRQILKDWQEGKIVIGEV